MGTIIFVEFRYETTVYRNKYKAFSYGDHYLCVSPLCNHGVYSQTFLIREKVSRHMSLGYMGKNLNYVI